ncbi:MAG: hypothetical protein ACK5KL_01230 [Dysgonomonas sp.]
MTQNKTRYNYGGCGRDGHNNKGKRYKNYNEEYIPSPEDMQRCTDFKEWFNLNYNTIKQNLLDKGKYDDDVMVNTFLKIYRYLEYGGIVDDYRTYWNTAYFTNIFYQEVTNTKYNNRVEYIEDEEQYDSIDDGDSELQYEAKDALIKEIEEWLNDNVDNIIHRDLFIIYINTRRDTKYKMTYQKLHNITGVPLNEIKEIIPKIKKQLIEKFKNKRLNTL